MWVWTDIWRILRILGRDANFATSCWLRIWWIGCKSVCLNRKIRSQTNTHAHFVKKLVLSHNFIIYVCDINCCPSIHFLKDGDNGNKEHLSSSTSVSSAFLENLQQRFFIRNFTSLVSSNISRNYILSSDMFFPLYPHFHCVQNSNSFPLRDLAQKAGWTATLPQSVRTGTDLTCGRALMEGT